MAVDLKPTAGMAEAARTGLRLHNEGKSGDGLKPETVRRANIIAARQELTEDHVREMNAWFARHESDRRPDWNKQGEETPGFVAWMLWSGDAGQQWSARKVEQLDREDDRSNAMEGMIEKRDVCFDADDEIVVETRSNGREVIRGLAIPYNRLSVDLGGFRERIMPGAFDKILRRQRGKGEIVSYFNHDPNWLLGRESAGTLEISVDDRGISYVVEPPDTQAGRDVLALVRSKNLRGSSFSFTVSQRGGERFTTDETGKAIREVVEAAGLFEMGPVVQPAYPSTSAAVAMRSYQAWLEEQRCGCEKIDGVAEQARKQQAAAAMSAAIRLTSARLKSFVRNCGTGSGGFQSGNTCGKGGGSGDSGSGESGGSGSDGGGPAPGAGPGPGGLQAPAAKHNVKIPKDKKRLTIDQSTTALKQLGYKVGPTVTKKVGKGWVSMVTLTDSKGHSALATADEVKDLVYGNQS
jgi:hypothetical protein